MADIKTEEKRGRGKPRRWATGEAFEQTAIEYIDKCRSENRLANVAGFSVFADITRETYYAQQHIYPDTYKKVDSMIEDAALNCTSVAAGIIAMYLKNKCGYRDRLETENINRNYAMDDADKKLLEAATKALNRTNKSDKA